MSNWRDRTERDATLSHRRLNPDSIQLHLNDNTTLDRSWRNSLFSTLRRAFVVFFAVFIPMSLTSTSIWLFVESLGDFKKGSDSKLFDNYNVVAVCAKDNKGDSVISIVSNNGETNRQFIKLNSKDRCKEIAIQLNEHIEADRKERTESANNSKNKIDTPPKADKSIKAN